jgi:hypothetical protein
VAWRTRSVKNEIEDIGAEIAASLILGVPFSKALGADSRGDICDGVQIRFTEHVGGVLFFYDWDKPDHQFILATGDFPTYTLRGWLWGHECKQPVHLDYGKEMLAKGKIGVLCHCVAQQHLHRMSTWTKP